MDSRYTRWVHHGEELINDEGHNFEEDADGHNFEDAGYQSDDDGYDQGNRDDISNLLDDLYRSGRQADGQPNLFANLMEEAKKELYDGCTNFTRLSFIIKLLHVKSYNRVTNAAFDGFLKLFNLARPNGNLVPKSYSEAKSVLRDVGLDYEIIHVCKYECELFWGEYANHDHCPTCGTSRWKDTHGKKKVPQKVLRYFPIIPRLQRFFASKFLAEMAMWHKVKRVVDKDVMRHPADGEAWKGFDSEYGWFARDPRNLKLGIATDGFNPFGMGSSYSMWPVFVIPYNFPPWMCMDQSNFMMALLIPGRKSPGKDFHVYMKPLMADMKKLWEGVDTFDALTGKRFPLHAAILWSIHDYPGLATISGRSTKGFYACVHCDENPCSQSLRNKFGYVGHRRFLPTNHHFRTSKLFNGKAERRGPPRKFTIEEVMEKLGKVEDYKPGKHPDFKKRKRAEKETRFNKDERNRDGKRVVDPAELPVFSVAAKAFGACRLKYFEKEYEKMVCVCREELLSRGVNNIDETVEKEFPRWFRKHDVEGEVNDEQRSDPDDEATSDADGQTMDDVGATEHEEISSSDDDEAAGDGEEANNSEHESDDD
ncbi:uncharacterized protein LOC100831630 [Brachypodium distachyon]|uniref:uncharacterized protein LOC100831630 n=1 Tax=Brachypodium distachyon TaxID=15368 RepID=UPI0005300136|nr:uncharacterized protein LOC100831630 [Brachypodium distachyon]|eukprot:XP_010233262.1 uncharacterized protein LOC100831630 [Brachypodium distachyon]